MNIKPYMKAIMGGITAGLGVAYVALNDGVVSPQEWVQIAEAVLVAGGAVYGIPNLPSVPGAHVADPNLNPPQD